MRFFFISIGLVFVGCKSLLERKTTLLTLPIEEKNDSTIILKAHLIDYNPKQSISEWGFVVTIGDSSHLYTSSKRIYTQHPDSLYQEFLIRPYTDTSFLFKHNYANELTPKKVFVKSYILQKDGKIIWANTQESELNWGSIQNVVANPTSITFDYVIDLREDCIQLGVEYFNLEYGFYYHTLPYPSENNHLGKITEYLADDFLLTCLFGNSKFTKTFTINNLQPNTTYYIRYYVKINNQIRYGQQFNVKTSN